MKTLSVKRAFLFGEASDINVYHGKLFSGCTAKTLIQIMRLIGWFVYHGKLFIRRNVFMAMTGNAGMPDHQAHAFSLKEGKGYFGFAEEMVKCDFFLVYRIPQHQMLKSLPR